MNGVGALDQMARVIRERDQALDLARELYEALRYYDDFHHPDHVLAALARYDQENQQREEHHE